MMHNEILSCRLFLLFFFSFNIIEREKCEDRKSAFSFSKSYASYGCNNIVKKVFLRNDNRLVFYLDLAGSDLQICPSQ